MRRRSLRRPRRVCGALAGGRGGDGRRGFRAAATPEPVEAAGASDIGGVPLSPLSPDALGIGRVNPFLGRDALSGGGTPDGAAAESAVERALRDPARARGGPGAHRPHRLDGEEHTARIPGRR